jgi:phage terminase small subunit
MAVLSINARQKAFADAILAGVGPSAAYLKAGYAPGSPKIVSIKAQQVLNRRAVQEHLAASRAKLEQRSVWTKEQMLATLRTIAESSRTTTDKVAAIRQAAKMMGYEAPQVHDHKGELVVTWQQ